MNVDLLMLNVSLLYFLTYLLKSAIASPISQMGKPRLRVSKRLAAMRPPVSGLPLLSEGPLSAP